MVIPAQKPTGPVQTLEGELVTKLHGTQLGSNYLQDPVLGMVRFLPDNLSWLRSILGPWVGILAATILFIATNAGLSACRGWPTRSGSTDSCRACWGTCTPRA